MFVVGETEALPEANSPWPLPNSPPLKVQETAFAQDQESLDCSGGMICWGLAPKVQLGGLGGGGGRDVALTVRVTAMVVEATFLAPGCDVPENVTSPLYFPTASPRAFAVSVRCSNPLASAHPFTAFPPAFRHPEAGQTVSHGALEEAVQLSVEP